MLEAKLREREAGSTKANRLFYMALPPTVFVPVAASISALDGPARKSGEGGWTRVIVEKPFGRDLASSREMSIGLAEHLSETATYRIDHYLGKVPFSNAHISPLFLLALTEEEARIAIGP